MSENPIWRMCCFFFLNIIHTTKWSMERKVIFLRHLIAGILALNYSVIFKLLFVQKSSYNWFMVNEKSFGWELIAERRIEFERDQNWQKCIRAGPSWAKNRMVYVLLRKRFWSFHQNCRQPKRNVNNCASTNGTWIFACATSTRMERFSLCHVRDRVHRNNRSA